MLDDIREIFLRCMRMRTKHVEKTRVGLWGHVRGDVRECRDHRDFDKIKYLINFLCRDHRLSSFQLILP